VTLPPEILRPNTLLTNLVIDDQTDVAHLQDGFLGDCDNVFVYMTDSTNPGILVYDARRDTAWRLSHPYMYPDPDFGTLSVRRAHTARPLTRRRRVCCFVQNIRHSKRFFFF